MRVFVRNIDAGHGWQEIITDDDLKIVSQKIFANSGYYTGAGNPEFIGKKTSDILHFWQKFKEIKNWERKQYILSAYFYEEEQKIKGE